MDSDRPSNPKLEASRTSLTRSQIRQAAYLLTDIDLALKEKRTLHWSDSQRSRSARMLRHVGVHLLSRTALRKIQQEPKRGTRPVAKAYFGAPLQRWTELFVLDVQTKPVKKVGVLYGPKFEMELLTSKENAGAAMHKKIVGFIDVQMAGGKQER